MMSNGEPSGIYNVVTKRPTGQTKGEASLMLGSYDLYRATLDLDGHFDKANRIQYRFNLMGQNRNSFRANEYSNRYSIAPVITYKIDDKTSLTAEYIFQHAKTSNVGSYYVFATQGFCYYTPQLYVAARWYRTYQNKRPQPDPEFTAQLQQQLETDGTGFLFQLQPGG